MNELLIQVASDLHLECYGEKSIPDDIIVPRAPVLALLGDVGLAGSPAFQSFLYRQAERFEQVIFLAGNHEYYNAASRLRSKPLTISDQQRWMKTICKGKSNLHFLERESMVINGVLILGTTLWSRIPHDKEDQAQSEMNDYYLSYITKTERMRVKHTNEEFTRNTAWLRQQIDANPRKPVVVLTHHTPCVEGTSHPRFIGSDLNCCFSTDLPQLFERPNVRVWACGHTHYNFDFTTNGGARLVSNQRGYPGSSKTEGYDKEGVVLRVSSSW